VLNSFTGVPLAPQKQSAGSSGCPQSKLIQGQSLSTSVQNTLLCTASEAKGSDCDTGEFDEADVVGDGSNDNNDLSLVGGGLSYLLCDARKRDRRAVDLGHEETFKDDFIEAGICAPGQETIELYI